jgi:hypothetical protein
LGLAEAIGLHSVVRPSITIYGAYTPNISQRNKEYIENESGPATILLPATGSIDGRYPTVTDSLSWLGLKSHFQAVTNTGRLLILERRQRPLQLKLLKLEEREIGFDDLVPVPDQVADVFVKIDIEPTLMGRLFNFVYKPAPAFITINPDKQRKTFRLINGLVREGMLLSPLLNDLSALQSFYGLTGYEPLVKVSAFRLNCQSGREWYYRDRIRVTFFRLTTQ